jgi:putative SOS response-associated peptidase YedK
VAEARRQAKAALSLQAEGRALRSGGVYDVWKRGGQAITSFAIVTTDAAPSVAQYQNRIPLVLDGAHFDDWLRNTAAQAVEMMKPYPGNIEA